MTKREEEKKKKEKNKLPLGAHWLDVNESQKGQRVKRKRK